MNLEEMQTKGLIKKLSASNSDVSKRMAKAEKWLILASKLKELDLETALEKAYDSILESGLAVMSRNGFRPTSKAGHHFAIMEYLSHAVKIDGSKLHAIRKSRNVIIYDDNDDLITEEYLTETIHFAKEVLVSVKRYLNKGSI